MSGSQSGKAAIQALGEILIRFAEAPGLMCDRLDNCQRILDAVRQFAKQQFLLLFPRLALGHIPSAFERELLPFDCLKDDAAFNGQFPTILGLVLQFAVPAAFIEQFHSQRGERLFACAQQLVFLLSNHLVAAVAVQFFAAAVPINNCAVEIPDEYGIARKVNELLLLTEPALTHPERIFRMTPVRHVDEGEDDAVDLVIDGAIWAQTNVVPAMISAANF